MVPRNLPCGNLSVRNRTGLCPVVEFQNVTKVFGEGKPAVDNVSLQILPGTEVNFLGPNGAGKTTSIAIVQRSDAHGGGGSSMSRRRGLRWVIIGLALLWFLFHHHII